jgi:hypothetical protein
MKASNQIPAPRIPEIKRITNVAQLLPKAREMVNRKVTHFYGGLGVKDGQHILIISDSSADQLVVEALSIAIREKGASLDVIQLEGFPGLKDPLELFDTMFANNWYPNWVWAAANEADTVLLAAFLKKGIAVLPPWTRKPVLITGEMNADQMVSEYEEFPVELRDIIGVVAWENIGDCSRVRWTDLEGTDLTINLKPETWKKEQDRCMNKDGYRFEPWHLSFPVPCEDMNGVYVTSSLSFGGPVPRTTLIIEGGKVVEVKGGGKFGDSLRESFEKYRNITGKKTLGPGINWITTMALTTHPKARRSPFYDELAGSARISAWSIGHRRSGVVHMSVGEGMVSSKYRIIRFMDTYFNTIVTEKGTVCENGHLMALEDPRVRDVAAKYGDPEKLLEECWIPAVSGVNAP